MDELLAMAKEALGLPADSTEDDGLLKSKIRMAAAAYVSRRYGGNAHESDDTGFPVLDWLTKQWITEALLTIYNQIGVEGQISHSENGIVRAWENAGVPESMMRRILPLVTIVSNR